MEPIRAARGAQRTALGWGPGVRSARWGTGTASQAAQVVDAIRGKVDRRARMVCALALAVPVDGEPSVEIFNGVVDGSVAATPRGYACSSASSGPSLASSVGRS